MADPDQVIGVSDVLVAGMQIDEAARRSDRLVVVVGLVEGIGRHQLGAGRPLRIGMLALDLLERLPGLPRIAVLEQIEGLVVELLDRPLDVVLLLGAGAAGHRQRDQSQSEQGAAETGLKRTGCMGMAGHNIGRRAAPVKRERPVAAGARRLPAMVAEVVVLAPERRQF